MVEEARGKPIPKDESNGEVLNQALMARTKKLWQLAPNWECVLKANRCFMAGELSYSPGSCGRSIVEETITFFDDFMFLHDYGFITTESQPHENLVAAPKPVGKGWYAKRQRPYIHFAFPTKHPKISEDQALVFLRTLYAFTKRDTSVPIVIAAGYEYKNGPKSRIEGRFPEFTTNIYGGLRHLDMWAVTEVKEALTVQALESSEWWLLYSDFGVYPNTLPGSFHDTLDYGCNKPFPGSRSADPINISISTRRWEAQWKDLMFVLETAIKAAELRPHFRTRKMNGPDRLGF